MGHHQMMYLNLSSFRDMDGQTRHTSVVKMTRIVTTSSHLRSEAWLRGFVWCAI
jgi:hypothetical protein